MKHVAGFAHWIKKHLLQRLALSAKQLAVLGGLTAIAGTLIVTSYNFAPLYFIPAALSNIGDLDHAWSVLRTYDSFQGELGVQTGITSDERGFPELLLLLEDRQDVSFNDGVSEIQVAAQMLYGNDAARIGSYVVQVVYGEETPETVIAWADDVSHWVEDERLRWALSIGFPVLCLGLILSLISVTLAGTIRPKGLALSRRLRWRGEYLTAALTVGAVVALGMFFVSVKTETLLRDLANLSLILTLLALVRYAYDTYRVSELGAMPTASLVFIQASREQTPLLLNSLPRNHSRIPIECWCNVHAKILGDEVDLDGFYGGKQPWNLQPYQEPRGVLNLADLLRSREITMNVLRDAWNVANSFEVQCSVLRLDVEFWYRTLNGRFQSRRFREGYYFDFDKNALVLHPHLQQLSV